MPALPAVTLDPAFVRDFRGGRLTPAQAKAFAAQDPLVIELQMLALAGLLGERPSPHAPPSSVPPFDKPPPPPRRKPRGAKPGHDGHARPKPDRIDRRVEHTLPACPDCGGHLTRTGRKRTRIVEDLPADLKAEATEHTLHRDWCPGCKKQVEPVVPDALPQCTLGHRAVTLSAWLHYGLGTTTSQIVEVFNGHLQLKITPGGLTQMWHRLAETLRPWYEQIWQECQAAAVLNADETGWSIEGVLCWLWCFACDRGTYYVIDESRGHAALDKLFAEEFRGVLVTDFWRAYDAVGPRQQKCWAHLLRELTAVEDRPDGARDDWTAFAEPLRRIYRDAMRLAAAHGVMPAAERDAKVARLHGRVLALATRTWSHGDAARLAKRLFEYGEELLTFAEFAGVPATNNRAEREIRPAVLMRKASYGNGSERGAVTRAILMSVYRTLKQRGLDPLAATRDALVAYTTTGVPPPLPVQSGSGG